MTRHSHPLQWPDGWNRTPDDRRTQSRFFYGLRESRKSLLIELERLGASDVAITSNLNGDERVTDPGVAVWFTLNGAERVMCCDRWLTPAENMRSIALSIEALRGLDRWGTRDVIARAFAGFTALPSGPPAEDWRHVLQLQGIITLPIPKGRDDLRAMWLAACRISYRALIKATHPDHGGNGADAARINAAMTEAERVLNRYTQTGDRPEMTLTADTITDDQIRALQTEASEAGDLKRADLCSLALGYTPLIAWNITPYGARGRCADAINNARAQTTRFTCVGAVRGGCGVHHKTLDAAIAHCAKDDRDCKAGHGSSAYSDRQPTRTDGAPLSETEMRYVDQQT